MDFPSPQGVAVKLGVVGLAGQAVGLQLRESARAPVGGNLVFGELATAGRRRSGPFGNTSARSVFGLMAHFPWLPMYDPETSPGWPEKKIGRSGPLPFFGCPAVKSGVRCKE